MSTCIHYNYDSGFFSTYYTCTLKEKLDGDKYITYDQKNSYACDTYESDRHENCPYLRRERESNSGCCFLTSACVKAKDLPDDCDELSTLRNFRDHYMSSLPNGNEDIKEYYRIAPLIVKAINSRKESADIWNEMYVSLVKRCVDLIKENKNAEAYEIYKSYVIGLRREYLEE